MSTRLFYFPPTQTEDGVMPEFYDVLSPDQIADARAAGAVDVEDSAEDRRAYERQLQADHGRLL